jgi:hypothetical protein
LNPENVVSSYQHMGSLIVIDQFQTDLICHNIYHEVIKKNKGKKEIPK